MSKCRSFWQARERKRLITRLLARDGSTCVLCTKELDRKIAYPHAMAITIDHVQHVSQGGVAHGKNLRCVHNICNQVRGNHTDEETIMALLGIGDVML